MTIIRNNNIIGGSNTEIFTIKEYTLYKRQCMIENTSLSDVEAEYKYEYINNSYDKIFRKILDNKYDATKIINRILEKRDYILSEDIEKYNSSFISDKLKNSEADIVYKMKNQDVFFLIEHQTKVDYSMAYRMLKYEIEIIDSVLIDRRYKNKKYKYPIVIPIVLYTGHKKWDAQLNINKIELRWNKYECQKFSTYNLIDVNKLDDNELIEESSFVSKILLIEKSNTNEKLYKNINKILAKISKEKEMYTQEQKNFLEQIIRILLQKKIGKDNTEEIIYKIRKETERNMLAVFDMIDKENARIRNEGKVEVIKNMLKEKLSIELISKVTGMKKEQIMKIQKQEKNCEE